MRQSVPSTRLVCTLLRITLSTRVVLINSANSIPLSVQGLWKHKTSWKSCCSMQCFGFWATFSTVTLLNPSLKTLDGGKDSSTCVRIFLPPDRQSCVARPVFCCVCSRSTPQIFFSKKLLSWVSFHFKSSLKVKLRRS